MVLFTAKKPRGHSFVYQIAAPTINDCFREAAAQRRTTMRVSAKGRPHRTNLDSPLRCYIHAEVGSEPKLP